MRRILTCALLLFSSLLCAKDVDIAVVDPVPVLFEDSNAFAFDLLLSVNKPERNLFASPFSIFTCLSMVYVGSDGDTQRVMKEALELTLSQHDLPQAYLQFFKNKHDPRLKIANAVWADRGTYFLPEYRETLQEDFEANAAVLNFLQKEYASSVINEWIDNQTEGKIPKLLQADDIRSNTRMILTNTIYFKGKWASPFNPKRTSNEPFYVKKYESLPTPMMKKKGHFSYFEDDTFQVVSLPFEKVGKEAENLACIIFLPKEHDGRAFTLKEFNHAIDELGSHYLYVHIPKFSLRRRLNLNSTLRSIGMGQAFTDKADFSKINGGHDLFISQVLHEATFDLDENGVEATAATSTSMSATGAISKSPILFSANRPFYFALIDLDTKGIYFLGKLHNPKKE